MQFLCSYWDTPEKRQEYVRWLWEELAPDEAQPPVVAGALPLRPTEVEANVVAPAIVHLAMLSYLPESSPKEATRSKTCLEILDSMAQSGFLSKHEPLLLCSAQNTTKHSDLVCPWGAGTGSQQKVIAALSLGHHKSAARSVSMHVLMTLIFDCKLSLKAINQELWNSLRHIHAWNMVFPSLKDQIDSNFEMSCRGSIRKPPNVLSWVHVLSKMRQAGEHDTNSIIRTWNTRHALAGHKLTGGKATAVRNVIENYDERIICIVMGVVSKFGWENSPFSDDSLSSRKIFPGTHWRIAQNKKWTDRMTVTSESAVLMFEHVVWLHENGVGDVARRPKQTKSALEEHALTAAVCCAVAKEAVAAGIAQQQVDKLFVEAWKTGNPRVSMELMSAIADKSPEFSVRDVTILRSLLDSKNASNTSLASEEAAVSRQSQELESATFELTMKKIHRDVEAWEVYKQKMEQWVHRVHAKKTEHLLKRWTGAKAAVQSFMEDKVHLLPSSDAGAPVRKVQELKKSFEQHGIEGNNVLIVGWLNWVAPSTLRSDEFMNHANHTSFILCEAEHNVVLFLQPQFSYKRGQLYLSEQMVIQMLSQRSNGLGVESKLQNEPIQKST